MTVSNSAISEIEMPPLPKTASGLAALNIIPLPTLRAMALCLGGVPLLALGTFNSLFTYIFWLFILLCLLVFAVEIWRLASPKEIKIFRVNDRKLSLGEANLVTLNLEYKGSLPLDLVLREETPADFSLDQRFLNIILEPETRTTVTYHVRPRHRGLYYFGPTVCRYKSPWGLFLRQHSFPTNAEVHVYPNLLAIQRYDTILRLHGATEAGQKKTRQRGTGGEFSRLREYRSDDEFRRINWKATARHGIPIAIEFETERSQNIMLLLDTGRLMSAPVGDLSKLDYAINAAMMLAYVATQKGDRAGLLAFADTIQRYIAPDRGRSQFLTILDSLYNIEPTLTEPDYRGALTYLHKKNRRRSLIVLFTDLIDGATVQAVSGYVASLAPRHLPLLVVLRDAAVVERSKASPKDLNTLYTRVVAKEVLTQRQAALKALHSRGVLTIDITPDQLTPALIERYLELKAKGRI